MLNSILKSFRPLYFYCKIHLNMKKALLLSLFISLFACKKTSMDAINYTCNNDSTSIFVNVSDFYTKENLPGIRFQILAQPFLSPYAPDIIQAFTSDNEGLGSITFRKDSLTNYHVRVLPPSDTSYLYPFWLNVRPGCDNNWKILMKPVQVLTLKIKNNSQIGLGKHLFYVARVNKNNTPYQNNDIDEASGYTFGYYQVDSIPIGFDKDFIFKVIPEENLVIRYGWPNTNKTISFVTENSASGFFTLSL